MKTGNYIRYLESGWRLARAEIAAVAALVVAGLGVLTFVGIADEIVERVERDAREVARMIAAGEAPFDGRAERWLAELAARPAELAPPN